ncbi:lipopolysaccharide kinase InaA family protein [Atopomonas sediminilitoris]|uniref:lipopolysaccharide kinase InaA family protein n=1 Tax=Atopomonas sediminilitoris TaxID=2919919 RepID=UPI001F4D73D7|nr:lipopolysaccharide kinase InaA family protein [Atopomonas sediminilitoris]MCJ8170316.1 serine/threonine protein kinase [Atopomonas sediminilitoris]
MTLSELRHAGRSPSLPLTLTVAGDELCLVQWLRVLPGKRYVAKALWRGQTVLAKLLVGDKSARDLALEQTGFNAVQQAGVATPELLASGGGADGAWLLYAFIDQAESLAQRWQSLSAEPLLSAAQQSVLTQALACVARLHAQGLWQADLHLDNLLAQAEHLYLVDAGGIRVEQLGQPLSAEAAIKNLAVLFAQLPVLSDEQLELLLVGYLGANAAHGIALDTLRRQEATIRQWRLRDYLRKCARDCSLFAVRHDGDGICAVRREQSDRLAELLASPDRFIEQGHLYKTGGAATVARVTVAGQPLLVKRYNIKNAAHWLKRCWRPSRAWHSWLAGNRLLHLGIDTPLPLAVIEKRTLGLRRSAYLITEYLPGEDIIARFDPTGLQLPPPAELDALIMLIQRLHDERISHGDLKGHNVLWRAGRWSLIDLDALQQHRSAARFAKAFAKDRERLLRNWPVGSPLYQALDQRLPTISRQG